jgi:hypothetical protein
MLTWWRQWRERRRQERRYDIAMAWIIAELRGDDEHAATFRRELDGMGGS